MKVIGHISRRINALNIGLAVFIDYDAIFDLHSGISHDFGDWLDPNTYDDEITIDTPANTRQDMLDVMRAFKCRHRLPKEHLYPVFTVNGFEYVPHLLAKHAKQWCFEILDHSDLNTEIAQRCRYLAAYEPHTDEHCTPTVSAIITEAVSISYRTQIVDPFQVSSRNS
jgi:hypothetical protein